MYPEWHSATKPRIWESFESHVATKPAEPAFIAKVGARWQDILVSRKRRALGRTTSDEAMSG